MTDLIGVQQVDNGNHLRGLSLVMLRKLFTQFVQDVIHVRSGLGIGDAGFETTPDGQPEAAPRFDLIGRQLQRRVNDIPSVETETKTCRHNADDGVRQAVKVDVFANDVLSAAEILLPHGVAEDGDLVLPSLIFAG